MRKVLRLLVPLALAACSPPSSSAKVDAELDEPVVIGAAGDDVEDANPSWGVWVRAAAAPAGEYLLFFSDTRPSSDTDLGGFDATPCSVVTKRVGSDPCDVPGVGTLWERRVLDTDGPLDFAASSGGGKPRQFFTIVRRNVSADAAPTPLSVTVTLSIDGGFCTANPEPPALLLMP